MHILITGICGFVGSALAVNLLDSKPGVTITGVDNLSRPGSWVNRKKLTALGVHVIHADIRNASDVQGIPATEWVIDAAANPSVLAGVDGKTSSRQLVEHNLAGTINLLEYCKKHQAGFILLSTSRVYSIPGLSSLELQKEENRFVPVPDQHFPEGIGIKGVSESYSTQAPVSLYGSTKVASEQLALEYGNTFQFPVWINRCGVLAGAGQFGHPAQGIFAFWVHSFREKNPLKYIGFNGTGYQVRDCLHPADLVPLLNQQFSEPLHTSRQRICNLSGGVENSMSLAELSAWCEHRLGAHRVSSTREERPYDIGWMVLDHSLASEQWGWQPRITIHHVLEEIARFAEDQPNWLELASH